jgi:hypothetical protein
MGYWRGGIMVKIGELVLEGKNSVPESADITPTISEALMFDTWKESSLKQSLSMTQLPMKSDCRKKSYGRLKSEIILQVLILHVPRPNDALFLFYPFFY